MTNNVNISITFTIENEKKNKLNFKLSAETLGKDLKDIEESLKVRLNASIVMYLDDRSCTTNCLNSVRRTLT